jgi:calcineurin-like phosphoesterase family protein
MVPLNKKSDSFPFNFGGLPDSRIFFTSDPHFMHKNIIKYCDRPFNDVKDMNQTLVDNWNRVVGDDDLIFCLGDFSLGREQDTLHILNSLNGHKVLIKGNHEKSVMKKDYTRNCFNGGIYDMLEIKVNDEEVSDGFQDLVLCHYPMLTWNRAHRGAWQLFGHVHGNMDGDTRLSPNQFDAGVDSHDFTPISYQTVKEIITKQNLSKIKK